MAKTALITSGAADETGDAKRSLGGNAMFAFVGTFGGATVTIEISHDAVVWNELHDQSGTTISVTSATQDIYAEEIKQEYEIRAVITGGDGTTDITVYVIQ